MPPTVPAAPPDGQAFAPPPPTCRNSGEQRTQATPWPAVAAPPGETDRMAKDTWRLVTRAADGELVIHDFDSPDGLLRTHLQVGSDDCSTDLGLRGAPVFRSLVGPMPEGRNIIRYETPEVFEALTKEWALPRTPRRRSRKKAETTAPETTDG
jgi:hypothetical protein